DLLQHCADPGVLCQPLHQLLALGVGDGSARDRQLTIGPFAGVGMFLAVVLWFPATPWVACRGYLEDRRRWGGWRRRRDDPLGNGLSCRLLLRRALRPVGVGDDAGWLGHRGSLARPGLEFLERAN